MSKLLNVFSPTLGQDELLAIADSFASGWIGKGPKVDEFERAWAEHIGVDAASVVSVNSCTEGLFQAIQLLGIGKGDEVIIPTIHFVGAAQAVLSAGAKPVFCDVDSKTLNTNAQFIWDKVTQRTVAIILNHYGGLPCDMFEIRRLGYEHIRIIEDAACAPASTYNGQAAGTFGDIGVWSFDAMKIISTGDGGMMYIRNRKLADRARKQIYLGTGTVSGLSSDKAQWWEFDVEVEGARRSVMNDIAAGIGLEQLKKLPQYIERRIYLNSFYNGMLGISIDRDLLDDSFYFYWIQTPKRDELACYLKEQGIYTTFRYWPLHLAYKTGDSLPNAEKAAREALLLPLHCGLSDDDVEFVCEKVKSFYAQ